MPFRSSVVLTRVDPTSTPPLLPPFLIINKKSGRTVYILQKKQTVQVDSYQQTSKICLNISEDRTGFCDSGWPRSVPDCWGLQKKREKAQLKRLKRGQRLKQWKTIEDWLTDLVLYLTTYKAKTWNESLLNLLQISWCKTIGAPGTMISRVMACAMCHKSKQNISWPHWAIV